MKSFLIIGVGSFGNHLVQYLCQQDCETLVIDKDEGKLEGILSFATSAKIADCTAHGVLSAFDVESFDACFVCIDSDFVASLEITSLLKEMGAKYVYSCADDDLKAKLLAKNGADHVIYPEKDMAGRIALNVSKDELFDSFQLAPDFYVFEIAVKREWVGKTLRDLDFRRRYSLSVLAVKENGVATPINSPEYVFCSDSHILVMGTRQDVMKATD